MSSVMTSGTLRISMPFRLRSQHDIIRDMCNVVYEAGARHRWQDGDQPYQRDTSGELWWCNSHQRKAEWLFKGQHRCDPSLGGITLPCSCVNLTNEAEVEE